MGLGPKSKVPDEMWNDTIEEPMVSLGNIHISRDDLATLLSRISEIAHRYGAISREEFMRLLLQTGNVNGDWM